METYLFPNVKIVTTSGNDDSSSSAVFVNFVLICLSGDFHFYFVLIMCSRNRRMSLLLLSI